MLLLLLYISVALGFSFLCSIAEAVILSVTMPYITLLEKEGKAAGKTLRELKQDINSPLAAILTLNTIAHTAGAAGAGAQATALFGSHVLGIVSVFLTLAILILSEIIPKTLGASYWRQLAPTTAIGLKWLVIVLYPFVKLSKLLTNKMAAEHTLDGFSREEFAVMAELGAQEGQLAQRESRILKNLFLLREANVKDIMTPRSVVFAIDQLITIEDFFKLNGSKPYSRIPIYSNDINNITGFVLRNDLLLGRAENKNDTMLVHFGRKIHTLIDKTSVAQAFESFLASRSHIMLVVDEYGDTRGIVTLEDILETLLGLEIVDESDTITDMQKLARKLWKHRAKEMGVKIEYDKESHKPNKE